MTEEQFLDLSRKEAIIVEEGGVKQKVEQMRKDTDDVKQGELRLLAHRFIDGAFRLGNKYADNKLDINMRAKILKRLELMNKKIDKIPD